MTQTYTVGARSRFVTLVAGTFLVLALAGIAAGIVEQASQRAWAGTLALSGDAESWPALTRWLVRQLPLVITAGVMLCGAMAVASVGLMQRLEWARRIFIAGLVLTLAVNLGGLWLQQEFVQLLVDTTHRRAILPPPAADVFEGLVSTARWLAAGVTSAVTMVLVGIIRRLGSPIVRQEFA